MDLTYTNEQAEYRRQVRRFCDGVLRPMLDEYDLSQSLTRAEIATMRAAIGPHEIATSMPLREDGRFDPIPFGIFIEEVSRIHIAFTCLNAPLFFPVRSMFGLLNERQREQYGWMFEPGRIVCFGLSEPDAGSNPSQIKTGARPRDGGWVISGHKMWTSHAQVAVGMMVVARYLDEDDQRIGLFLLDIDRTEGLDIRKIPTLGMGGISTNEVWLEDCWAPADAEITLGPVGLRSALGMVEQARLVLIFQAVGLAQASLDLALDYAKSRSQFGRPIASFQLVQDMLAEMATLTEAMRLMAYRAAALSVGDESSSRAATSMAKCYCAETGVRVTSLGIQVQGGTGLTKECTAERYFRDARMLTIPDGTSQIHSLVVGRHLTGISAIR